MRTALTLFVGTVLLTVANVSPAQRISQTPIDTRPVPLVDGVSPGEFIGAVRFLGMLALPSLAVGDLRFSELSDLAWDDDEGVLYAISDKGTLFGLRPIFQNEILTGLELLGSARLEEQHSGKPLRGRRTDSEGMDIRNGRNGRTGDTELVISFERFPRITGFRPDGRFLREYPLPDALADGRAYRGTNRMLEAVCLSRTHGYLTTPELPLRGERAGFSRLFSESGKTWLYPIEEPMRVAAIECLDDDHVLILERDFGRVVGRTVVRIRRAKLAATPSSDTQASTETLISMNSAEGFQIDNFEGMTRHRGNRYFLISDDNDLFIQRTLLLYLELPPPAH